MELPTPASVPTAAVPALSCRHRWYSRFFEWAAGSRSHRVILLVIGIWILNTFDLLLTLTAHQQGLLQEGNPVARWMFSLGIPSVILFKVGLVMIGSYPLLRFRTARITELGTIVILIAYGFLAVHWSTCYELYAATVHTDLQYADVQTLNARTSE